MANIGEITVPVNYEITPTSKQVLKGLIAETIREALEGSNTVFPSQDELRAFVRAEVHKALMEDTTNGIPDPGPNAPHAYKEMPNPTPEQVEHDPTFQAIWNVIKTWDVNAPEYYFGYCGANGSHVALILNALEKVSNTNGE